MQIQGVNSKNIKGLFCSCLGERETETSESSCLDVLQTHLPLYRWCYLTILNAWPFSVCVNVKTACVLSFTIEKVAINQFLLHADLSDIMNSKMASWWFVMNIINYCISPWQCKTVPWQCSFQVSVYWWRYINEENVTKCSWVWCWSSKNKFGQQNYREWRYDSRQFWYPNQRCMVTAKATPTHELKENNRLFSLTIQSIINQKSLNKKKGAQDKAMSLLCTWDCFVLVLHRVWLVLQRVWQSHVFLFWFFLNILTQER